MKKSRHDLSDTVRIHVPRLYFEGLEVALEKINKTKRAVGKEELDPFDYMRDDILETVKLLWKIHGLGIFEEEE